MVPGPPALLAEGGSGGLVLSCAGVTGTWERRVIWVRAPKATSSVCLQSGGQEGLQWVSAWDPGPRQRTWLQVEMA